MHIERSVFQHHDGENPSCNILFVASECSPFVTTGGMADVIDTLPHALSEKGMDIRVILPYYRDISTYWKGQFKKLVSFFIHFSEKQHVCTIHYFCHENITYYFVENEFYFGRDQVVGFGTEEGERFIFFNRAVLECLPLISFQPDVIHCHDWQSGIIPFFIKNQYQYLEFYKNIKTLFTIHNLKNQGIFDWDYMSRLIALSDRYLSPDSLEYYGKFSFIKAGIRFADKISTVSPSYAQEIQTVTYGENLDSLIRDRSEDLYGILNGIDNQKYNPETDIYLFANYNNKNLMGKAINKANLQRDLGLDLRPNIPMIGVIGKLIERKGMDLLEESMEELMKFDIQLVLLGMGEERFQDFFSWASWRYQGRLAACIENNIPLSRCICASSDMLLIPSHFEPCGLMQMIAMRYGCIPIVRETGGLRDSILPYEPFKQTGNGFSFKQYNVNKMLDCIQTAISVYYDEKNWYHLIQRAFASDFGWDKSAENYKLIYKEMTK